MRRTKTTILAIAIALTASVALAAQKAPHLETIIIHTLLAPAGRSPLANLDLIPPSATTDAYDLSLVSNQNARIAALEYGQRYLVRNVRAAATGDVLFKINLATMIALNLADYFSTNACLNHGGFQEGNPLMKPFTASPVLFAAAKIGTTALSYFAWTALYKKSKPLAWAASFVSNLALSYIVSNNIRFHSRSK
jgi:hypothetical protein